MKKLLGITVAVILAFILLRSGEFAQGASKDEMIDLVRKVAQDYRKEQKFDTPCSINGQSVSLGGVLYALALQEGGYINGSLGDRTNNRGSLHGSMGVKPVKGYTKADGSKSRPIYNTPYDGVYEKAHMIATKPLYNTCSIGYKQLFAYIVGPKADPNKLHPTKVGGKNLTNAAYVRRHLSKMYGRANEFDQMKPEVFGKKFEAPKTEKKDAPTTETQKPSRVCYWIAKVKAGDYIQLDSEGQLKKQIDVEKGTMIDVFNCFGSKK